MSSNARLRLQPIYAALDNHQYAKAAKLCLQQPPESVLARALLAHALAKSGQRFRSLQVLAAIVGDHLDCFPELRLELAYSQPYEPEDNTAANKIPQPPAPTSAAPKKGGKKGKKKPAPAGTSASTTSTLTSTPGDASAEGMAGMDWVDRLDVPPRLPEDWDRLPPPSTTQREWLGDGTTVPTLVVTMRNHLRLPLTAFQLYRWSLASAPELAAATPDTMRTIAKAFGTGLAVLVAPQYAASPNVTLGTLRHMQGLAMQLARHCQTLKTSLAAGTTHLAPEAVASLGFFEPRAVLWAAQTCLWQEELVETTETGSTTGSSSPLVRIAESLAARGLDMTTAASPRTDDDTPDFLLPSECFMLYLDTLEKQGKLTDKLEAIIKRLGSDGACGNEESHEERGQTPPTYPPRKTLLDLKAHTLHSTGDYKQAQQILTLQLHRDPDDWSFWMRHADCTIKDDWEATYKLSDEILASANGSSVVLRGPRLIRVELAYRFCLMNSEEDRNTAKLAEEIMSYAQQVAPQAMCCYADLEPYLEWIVTTRSNNENHALKLLEWLANSFRLPPSSNDGSMRRKELRQYITALQITHKILFHMNKATQKDHMPDWKQVLKIWKDFQEFDIITADDPKENRPTDELILLVSQQLLWEDSKDEERLLSIAVILEAGIKYSPYSGNLKIAAMRIYGLLHAATTAYELFRSLYIKHIQHESCSYLILSVLRENGLYEETIEVSKEIIRLQRLALNEAAEFSSRALDNGVRSKADEFIRFQRRQMNKSLTALEAKGLILDSAPMFGQAESQWVPGAFHGLVGCEADGERAMHMIAEAHDPLAAFSILQLPRGSRDDLSQFIDNRDLEMLVYESLSRREVAPASDIIHESIRRGHIHGLLIRAALCVAASKGTKKGKLVEASDELRRRCTSLLRAADLASVDSDKLPTIHNSFLKALIYSCRVLSGVNTGIFLIGDSKEEGSLEAREKMTTQLLAEARALIEFARSEMIATHGDPVGASSRLLAEAALPVFAITQMCASVFELFGWGRRKRQTKPCAAALADVAAALSAFIEDATQAVAGLPKVYDVASEFSDLIASDIISESLYRDTIHAVRRSQEVTHERITGLGTEMVRILASFDVQD